MIRAIMAALLMLAVPASAPQPPPNAFLALFVPFANSQPGMHVESAACAPDHVCTLHTTQGTIVLRYTQHGSAYTMTGGLQ